MCGIIPVIGPSWENFIWVGTEIIDSGLLKVAGSWQEAAALLLKDMESPAPRNEIIHQSLEYIKERQGGAEKACHAIAALMEAY